MHEGAACRRRAPGLGIGPVLGGRAARTTSAPQGGDGLHLALRHPAAQADAARNSRVGGHPGHRPAVFHTGMGGHGQKAVSRTG
jgi:hypothetical protein